MTLLYRLLSDLRHFLLAVQMPSDITNGWQASAKISIKSLKNHTNDWKLKKIQALEKVE